MAIFEMQIKGNNRQIPLALETKKTNKLNENGSTSHSCLRYLESTTRFYGRREFYARKNTRQICRFLFLLKESFNSFQLICNFLKYVADMSPLRFIIS